MAQATAGITTVPSPIGGVDFYSPLFGMPAENAIRLTNWWPEVYGMTHRKGYRLWADALPANVGSLYTYHTRTRQSFLYAFAGEGMYDVTSADTVTPPPARVAVVSGLTTAIWQGTMFSNSAGTHKVLVSGQDDPIWVHQTAPPAVVYDRIVSGDGTGGTIAGFDPKNAIDVAIHQKRLWFVEKDTTNGWYLPAEQVTGVASKFDFGPLFKRGGYLQSLSTWTVDGGDGPDDLLVAFGSEGDIVVYKGTDPDSADTWALQGVYYAGALLEGHRFHTKVSGDLKFITTQGLISMNEMFTSSQTVSPQSNIEARPVQQFLAEQANLYGFLQGWDVKFIPSTNMLIINIPSVVEGGSLQLVENVVNSRWSTFLGWDAACFCPDYQDVPFFAQGTRVLQGWIGHADNVSLTDPAGKAITALVQQAYNYLGTPSNNKQVGMYRPNFLTDRQVVWRGAILYDFKTAIPTLQINPAQPGIPLWDSAIWDLAIWGGGLHAQKQWAHAAGIGMAASLAMATRSDGEVIWVNTDMTVLAGGIL
jgi:hypothetical protein